ncbi:hypothetical protein GCM10011571_08760 [Marinithermofilum abyssi]|uniref:Uncharacterized protein n=1 Tax=Marinithermofilum abyssi TaxID=1571185 RepID=A0A8J2Y8V2_9BACL|nr:hypothetical protein GCM10011571_08760 [Marinithermofilum abyssi]
MNDVPSYKAWDRDRAWQDQEHGGEGVTCTLWVQVRFSFGSASVIDLEWTV